MNARTDADTGKTSTQFKNDISHVINPGETTTSPQSQDRLNRYVKIRFQLLGLTVP